MTLNEQYLAGAILLEQCVIFGLDGLVTAEDFENGYCRTIFEAAEAIKNEGGTVDPASITRKAMQSGVELTQNLLAELMQITPTAVNYAEYARRVAEDARMRRVKDLASQVLMDDTATADELLERMQEETGRLTANQSGNTDFLSLFKPLSEFEEEEPSWVILNWIPEGQIALIAADGGVGKTTLWVHIFAALSAGRGCILDPPGYTRNPMKIAFCTTEDSVKKKLRRKLRAAGANMDNIVTMDISADKNGVLKDFKFGSKKMESFLKHFRPAICVFDPVQGFIPPRVNMGSRNEMRDCMAPLVAIGEDIGTTSLVICHTNKRKGAYGRDRIADSADLWDIARSVIMAGYTENQGERYLSNEKNNYAPLQETVLYSVDNTERIVQTGTSWKRDREYMLDATTAKAPPKRDDCKGFILNALTEADGRYMLSDELTKKARQYGYAFTTIKRAREELNQEGATENYYTGVKGKKGRLCFVRIKQGESTGFEELPYEDPVPFDSLLD